MSAERSGPAICNVSNIGEGKDEMTKASIDLQDLRRRIYVKAKAEPSWRFWGLYVHVCKMETLRAAYEMAKRNDGAPGIDGVTFEAIEVLGRFDAILNGVGELPGYGLSIWTFWQSRSQLVDTYNVNGADTMIATAEMLNIFNLPASLPKENEYWSNAIGTYTGIKITTTPDSKTGKPVQTKTTEELRLVPA